MNVIVLDIETTGDNYNIDEICQMSYFILNENLHMKEAKNFFFKVDYVHFKSSKSKLNINELKILSNNKFFRDNCEEIFNDLNGNIIVCHNIEHDINFINSEFLRCGIKNFEYNGFCTMKYYTDILKIKHDLYGYKYPKLEEIMPYFNIKRGDIVGLCDYYFGEKDINLHDSRFDISILYYIVKYTDDIENIINKIKSKEKVICNENESNYKSINQKEDLLRNKDNEINEDKNKKFSIKDALFDLFSFKNRIGRKEYIYRLVFMGIFISSIYGLIDVLYYYNDYDSYVYNRDNLYYMIKIIDNILPIFIVWLFIATSIKRLHDINKKGIYLTTLILPIINLITWFDLFFKKGDESENNFGLPRFRDKHFNNTKKFINFGYIISIIILIICGIYIDNVESTNLDKAIDIVINDRQVFDWSVSVEEEIDSRISKLKEESILDDIREFGWDAIHIEDSVYLVSYDFDKDNNDDNGYSCFPFEVDISSGYVNKLDGDIMKEEYKDILGDYKNEFDLSWY